MKAAKVKADAAAMWGMFSSASQAWFMKSASAEKERITKDQSEERLAAIAEEYGMTTAEYKAADPKRLAIAILARLISKPRKQEKAEKSSLVKADAQEDKAFCEIKEYNGDQEFVVLVKEGGK